MLDYSSPLAFVERSSSRRVCAYEKRFEAHPKFSTIMQFVVRCAAEKIVSPESAKAGFSEFLAELPDLDAPLAPALLGNFLGPLPAGRFKFSRKAPYTDVASLDVVSVLECIDNWIP